MRHQQDDATTSEGAALQRHVASASIAKRLARRDDDAGREARQGLDAAELGSRVAEALAAENQGRR